MKVVIRLNYGSTAAPSSSRRHTALMAASLMTPIALMAWALAGWRVASDMNWTGQFAIGSGLLSHWQVWIALGIAIQFGSFLLQRFGLRED